MKISFWIICLTLLCVSCGSLGTKKNTQNSAISPKIILTEYKNDYSAAYTDDGHTMIFKRDSVNNIVVYYAKFNINYKNRDNDKIKDVIVRVELDFTLDSLKSILFFTGGIFCEKKSVSGYKVCYYDEDLNKDSIQYIEIESDLGKETDNKEDSTKRIIQLLNSANQIVMGINNGSAKGWHNIVSALGSTQEILADDVISSDVLHDSKISKRISKISKITDWLNQYNSFLRSEMYKEN